MTMDYTDTNGHRVTTAPRLPGFRNLCLFTAVWAAAAAAARLSRPPALGEAPAGYPGGDHPNIANLAYNVLTYIPEETALVIAAALLGWAIATGIDECYTLGARRHRQAMMSMALTVPLVWPLGIGPALAGLAMASLVLWPTCIHPERATPQLVLLCGAAAVAGPLFNLFEHYDTLLEQGRQFGDDAGDLTGWASNAWQTNQPWAGEAQRAQTTGSWGGWWNLQTTLGFTKETSYRVYTATMLACTGLLLGLRIGSEKTPMTYAKAIGTVHRQYLLLLGTIGAGTAATMLGIINEWEGVGPRLAATVSVVTALLAGRLILETPRVDETNRLVAASRAVPAPGAGNDGPEASPGTVTEMDIARRPLPHLGAALIAYAAGTVTIHLVPWTSPTPIGAGLYGNLDGAGTLAGIAVGATAATAAFFGAMKMHQLARKSREQNPDSTATETR